MNRSMTVALMFAVAACAGRQASKTDASSSGSMSGSGTSSSGSMSSSGASGSGMQSGASSSGMQSGGQSFSAKMDAASEVPQPKVGSAMPSCTATFQSDGQSL